MSRRLVVAAAQMGPVQRSDTRAAVLDRLLDMFGHAADRGADLVVFPELALTTFFPRWWQEPLSAGDHWYETEMPGPEVQALFEAAAKRRVGFFLGYAELTATGHRYNTSVIVDRRGSIAAKYRKVHIPGHDKDEPWRPFQHLERYYFEPGPDGFAVHDFLGARVGMMICNDRRWPETYRVMGLQGVEMILCGYNTPIHYPPDPSQDVLAGFHNQLVLQAGAYQNGTWVVAAAKGGNEEGVDSLAQSCIVAPSGQVVAQAITNADEVIVAECDIDWCARYKGTLFDFDRYRRPECYAILTEPDNGESSRARRQPVGAEDQTEEG